MQNIWFKTNPSQGGGEVAARLEKLPELLRSDPGRRWLPRPEEYRTQLLCCRWSRRWFAPGAVRPDALGAAELPGVDATRTFSSSSAALLSTRTEEGEEWSRARPSFGSISGCLEADRSFDVTNELIKE